MFVFTLRSWRRCSLLVGPLLSPLLTLSCFFESAAFRDLLYLFIVPAGRTCFPQQRPGDVHGGLLRLPPGRVGASAHRSSPYQKGKK